MVSGTKPNSLTPKTYCRSRRLTRQKPTSIEQSTYSTLWEADLWECHALSTPPVATLCITLSAAEQVEQEHEKSSKRQRTNAQHTTSRQPRWIALRSRTPVQLCSKSRAQLRYVERQKCRVQSLEKLCKDVCAEKYWMKISQFPILSLLFRNWRCEHNHHILGTHRSLLFVTQVLYIHTQREREGAWKHSTVID